MSQIIESPTQSSNNLTFYTFCTLLIPLQKEIVPFMQSSLNANCHSKLVLVLTGLWPFCTSSKDLSYNLSKPWHETTYKNSKINFTRTSSHLATAPFLRTASNLSSHIQPFNFFPLPNCTKKFCWKTAPWCAILLQN